MKTKLPELSKLLDTLLRVDTINAKMTAYLKIKAMFRKLENENAMLGDEEGIRNKLNILVYALIFATAFILGALF